MSSNMNWTMEQDEILIDFVKNHEAIYNVTCNEYKKTQMKQHFWREIGGILINKTDVDCSKRWSYIRDYYIRRRRKPGTGSSGEVAKKRSHLLSFLDSCSSTKRSSIASVASTDDNNKEDISVPEEDVAKDDTVDVAENSTPIMKKRRSRPSKKIKTSTHSEERIELRRAIAHRQPQPEEKDETDLFFNAMSLIVKKLSQYERAQLRMQITTLVSNAELRQLANRGEYPTAAASTSSYNNYNECLGGIFSPGSSESIGPASTDSAD